MRNNIKKPGLVLATALLVFFTGGFLLLVHIGASARTAPARPHGPAYRAPEPAVPPSYLEDFERGGGIVVRKGGTLFAGIFGGSAQAPAASGQTAAARYGAGRGEDPDQEGDAFEEYYRKNYASKQGRAAADAPSSWTDGWGGSSSGGGSSSSGGGFDEGQSPPSSGKERKEAASGGGDTAGGPATVPDTGSGFGKPPTGEAKGAAPQLHASLPGKNSPENAGLNLGGGPAAQGRQDYKGGNLSGMPGGKAGAALNGAEEGMKAGAQSSYNSKLSGGAAAAGAAGAGGGSAPAASGPKETSAAGPSAKTGADAAKPGEKAAPGAETSGDAEFFQASPAPADEDLVRDVVAERRNGADSKFVTEEEAAGEPEENLLKPRSVTEDEPGKAAPAADPADLRALSPERKKELKKEVHTFLKRVENKYGKMTDIYRTPCSTTPDLCKEHEVSGSYLTMTTQKGAKLVLGFKYVEKRWRRYTMDFKPPPGLVPPPAPKEPREPEGPERPVEPGEPADTADPEDPGLEEELPE
ncbi:MAG: hypothetical protein HY550_00250 [Elusimicrobia bacterium]|nr:hypothetical protein [Elusimicrobiota bacterium]